MKNLLIDESYYFKAFIKSVQYLATLTTHHGIMGRLQRLIKIFYNSDFFASYECGVDGKIIELLKNFSNNRFSKEALKKIGGIIGQTLKSGFFASELINTPKPYAMAFLPISKANKTIFVIVIGHQYSETLPKYLLNIYLALAGFIGTTIEKLTIIQELRIQYIKLEELIEELEHEMVERKQTENILKENERFLTNIFTSIQDGLCVIDKDYNIIRANPTMENWYSHMKPILGKKCYQVYRHRNEICENCECIKIIKSNKSFSETIISKVIDNEIGKILDIYSFPFLDQETGELKGFIKYLRDVTELKRAENELKESEEKYALILKNANDLIAILNDKYQYEYVNENVLMKLLYLSKENIIGKTPLDLVHSDDIQIASQSMKKCLETGECMAELRFIKKDGSSIWLENKGKKFFNEKGERKVLVISRDISKRKKAEKMIRKEIEKLKEIDQMRSELVRRISHELKTPLVLVCNSTELLLTIYKKHYDDKAKELIEFIDRGGKRLKKLVKNTFDITRLESKKLELKKQKENLAEIIKDCVEEMRYFAENRELSLNIDLLEELYLDVDKIRIEEVIINIITNAIKNTPAKGKINVKLQENEDSISLSIRDTGIGLTEREIGLLFKKFGKIERYGKGLDVDIEGSGLGLYISKEIVALHGGEIWAESEGENKGSTFTIKLFKN